MPRIRHGKEWTRLRPVPEAPSPHLDDLVAEAIAWHRMHSHLPDRLWVVLSSKAGHITAFTP
jgi:hypothetical protein